MKEYDYREAMIADIKEYLSDNNIEITDSNREELEEELYDKLWDEDSITGNGPFNYASEEECKTFIMSVPTPIIADILREYDTSYNTLLNALQEENIYRFLDTSIRCYYLGECLYQVLYEEE